MAQESVEAGSELSPPDRDRIAAEVALRLELAGKSAPKRGFAIILNSPFVVTLLGGLIVALLTWSLNSSQAHSEQMLARSQALFERRMGLVARLNDQAASSIEHVTSMLEQEDLSKDLAKALAQATIGSSKWSDLKDRGREVKANARKLYDLYTSSPNYESVLAEISAFFDAPEIGTQVVTIEQRLDSLSAPQTAEQIRWLRVVIGKDLVKLTKLMTSEAKNKLQQ